MSFESSGTSPLFDRSEIVLGAERVELEELTTVVLVRLALVAREVVEVVEHRRVFGDSLEHDAEVTEEVLADPPIVGDHHWTDPEVPAVDVEVIVPEVGHDFAELLLAVDRAHEGGQLELLNRSVAASVAHDVIVPELRRDSC